MMIPLLVLLVELAVANAYLGLLMLSVPEVRSRYSRPLLWNAFTVLVGLTFSLLCLFMHRARLSVKTFKDKHKRHISDDLHTDEWIQQDSSQLQDDSRYEGDPSSHSELGQMIRTPTSQSVHSVGSRTISQPVEMRTTTLRNLRSLGSVHPGVEGRRLSKTSQSTESSIMGLEACGTRTSLQPLRNLDMQATEIIHARRASNNLDNESAQRLLDLVGRRHQRRVDRKTVAARKSRNPMPMKKCASDLSTMHSDGPSLPESHDLRHPGPTGHYSPKETSPKVSLRRSLSTESASRSNFSADSSKRRTRNRVPSKGAPDALEEDARSPSNPTPSLPVKSQQRSPPQTIQPQRGGGQAFSVGLLPDDMAVGFTWMSRAPKPKETDDNTSI